MAKFDKYLLSQLTVLFGFFSLILVLVFWVNRAVALFDRLIANGHSVVVFLEFSALSLPNVIRLILPIAAFVAAIYCANRMASDSELVVIQSTGYSPYRLARPVWVFGLLVALMLSALTHVLVPASLTRLAERKTEIEANSTARLLREGRFLHPAKGVTFYIRNIAADGALVNVFLSDNRTADQQTNYSARRALLVKGEEGPKLIMFDGMAQNLSTKEKQLSTTGFSELVLDIAPLLLRTGRTGLVPQELATRDLLWPDDTILTKTNASPARLAQLGHSRIAQALMGAVVGVIGFAAILMGGFSRYSLWKQVLGATLVLILLKTADNFLNDFAARNLGLWPLVYGAPVLGAIFGYLMLWFSAHRFSFQRRLRAGNT